MGRGRQGAAYRFSMETGSADRVGHVAHGGHGAAVHVRGVLQGGDKKSACGPKPLPLSVGAACRTALPLFNCGGVHVFLTGL